MRNSLYLILMIISPIYVNSQIKITGQLVDEYGNDAWAEIFLNGQPTKWMDNDGKIDLESDKSGVNEITIKYFGHYTTKIIINCKNKNVDLGDVHLISNQFWLDGPKKGVLSDSYDNGFTKYKINLKKWRPHKESLFYNSDGELTQKLIYNKGKLMKIYVTSEGTLKQLNFEMSAKGEITTLL